jgi:hypothetical protein
MAVPSAISRKTIRHDPGINHNHQSARRVADTGIGTQMACGRPPSPPYTLFGYRLGLRGVIGMELDGRILGQIGTTMIL